jgi:hypothetical protein
MWRIHSLGRRRDSSQMSNSNVITYTIDTYMSGYIHYILTLFHMSGCRLKPQSGHHDMVCLDCGGHSELGTRLKRRN